MSTVTAPTQIQGPTLVVKALDIQTMIVTIIGTSPLLMHNFSEKSRRQMLDSMQGTKRQKSHRVPDDDYQQAFYRINHADGTTGYGFPVLGFKAATVSAARFFDKSVSMVTLRQVLFFEGVRTAADPQELIEITGTPVMREDFVRVGMTTDLRYRPEFAQWSAKLVVRYIATSISQESVLSLINAGGFGVGVGEWRPEKSGQFGQYQVDPSSEILVVR